MHNFHIYKNIWVEKNLIEIWKTMTTRNQLKKYVI